MLYQWIGGTRSDWRGQGHFRALTEEQEVWALANGFDEILVKTKNRFYEMRAALAQLHFHVIRFVPHTDRQPRVEGVPEQAARPARRSTRTAAAASSPAATTSALAAMSAAREKCRAPGRVLSQTAPRRARRAAYGTNR